MIIDERSHSKHQRFPQQIQSAKDKKTQINSEMKERKGNASALRMEIQELNRKLEGWAQVRCPTVPSSSMWDLVKLLMQ